MDPTFHPRTFQKNMAQFVSKQTSYGGFDAKVEVTLRDNKTYTINHPLVLKGNGGKSKVELSLDKSGCESYNVQQLPIPMDITFGIELELITTKACSMKEIASHINGSSGYCCRVAERSMKPTADWRISPDSSVSCNGSQPGCTPFELISPVLHGGLGLQQVHEVLQAVNTMGVHADNRTAGFHVHVGVGHLSFEQVKKVCQNFVKYEIAFDLMVPLSRRNNEFCASNRRSNTMRRFANKEANEAIGRCQSMDELYEIMNPSRKKYFKLNLTPLASGRQATIEFRQHSATSDYAKVAAWVRLVVHFVNNAGRFEAPRALLASRGQDDAFKLLFKNVIKDRYLRDYYLNRADELSDE
jgi:hypothetical protein